MNKQAWGTALHTLLDGGTIDAHHAAALRLVADDIECSGIGGPLETELTHAMAHDADPDRRLFAQRLLGNVKKWGRS